MAAAAAAAGDSPAGFFPGVWSRLHAAVSSWRRRGEASGIDANEEEEESTVRSRLVRRAAAARRVGRKLAFLSFNMEVLVFIYTFWRARRRNLSWRQPIQALPMLVIPALATLIYAAFVRFTRMLDHKDKKMLERLQEEKQETDGEPRESDQIDGNSVQNCDDVHGASNSLVAADSMTENSMVRKHRQSSINLRDDGVDDISWGHSKDFQPMPSDGLRKRRFSTGKAYMTNNGVTESSDEKTWKTASVSAHSSQHGHAPISTGDTVSYPFDDSQHSRPVISSMLAEPANIHQELPARDGEEERIDGLWGAVDTRSSSSTENPTSPVGSDHGFCDRDDSCLSEHGISSLSTVFQELLVKASEEHSPSLPEKLEFSPVFIKEAPASPPDYVAHSSLNNLSSNLPDPVLPASETFKKLPAEGVMEEALLDPHKSAALQTYPFILEDIPTPCAVDDSGVTVTSDGTYSLTSICGSIHSNEPIVDIDTASPKLNLLHDLLGEGVEENDSSKLHALEGNITPCNSEEEVSVCPLSVNNTEHSMRTPEFSLCSQETDEMDAAGSVNFIKVSPKLSFLSSPELVVEGGEEASEKETCELNTKEDNDTLINLEDKTLQVELVVSPTEQCFEVPELSLCCQDAKIMEVPGIVYFATVSPESNHLTSPELPAEGGEDSREDGIPNLHLHEQKGLPFNLEKKPFLDPLVVDTAEGSLVTPEFLLCGEEVQMTEYEGVVEEVLSESEEGTFNHQNFDVTSVNDGNAQYLISNSMSAQFIPDSNIKEALQGGQETLSEPPHESTCRSEGIFLSSGEVKNDELEVPAPFSGQGGLLKPEDEMAITSLDTPILLDEVRSAENMTGNSVSSPYIPDSNRIQSLQDGKQAPSETLKEVTFLLEESLMSSDEGVNFEIFSLYSRSSSCVSEVNTAETLKGGTSSKPENDHDFSSDERNPVIFHKMDSTGSYTNNPTSAEFILESNMMETLKVAGEETASSQPEVSSNFPGTFVAPDVSNGMRQSDKHLDLLSFSFAPVVDAFESLQTIEGFSELQCENDFFYQETDVSPKGVNNAEDYLTNTIGDPENDGKTATVPLQAAQQGLAESQYEDAFTLDRTNVSPEDTSDAENSFSADCASDFPNTVESHCFSEKPSPISQVPLSFEEILVYSDEGSKTENDLDNAKLSLCSTDVNLTEPLGNYQEATPEQQDETILIFEDIYMARDESTSKNHFNNSGSQDIPDAIMTETLQGAERLSSEILHDGIFSSKGTLVSLDGGDDAELFCINPGSVTHTAEISTTGLLGLQEGSFEPKDEREINNSFPDEVNFEETSSSNRGNSSSASCHYDISFAGTPQELPADAGSEKVSPKDKKPKDGESEDMKVDVENLDEDNENSSVDPFGVDEISSALVPKPSVQLYAEDASWRESTMWTSNDFEVAQVASFQQRKPALTVRNSTRSSTVSELADVKYTEPVNDDIVPLSACLPSSVADQMILLHVFQ